MTFAIYSLYDRVAEECGPIWTAKNDAVAVRNARIALRSSNAEEFRLFCLAEFDTEKACIFAFDKREVVCDLKEVVKNG